MHQRRAGLRNGRILLWIFGAWQQRKDDATENDGFYDLGNAPAQPEAEPDYSGAFAKIMMGLFKAPYCGNTGELQDPMAQ